MDAKTPPERAVFSCADYSAAATAVMWGFAPLYQ